MKHFFWRIAAVVLALGVYVSSAAWASGLGQDVRIGIREERSSVTLSGWPGNLVPGKALEKISRPDAGSIFYCWQCHSGGRKKSR